MTGSRIQYAKYFDSDGGLNLDGEVAMSVGVLALFFLMSPAIEETVSVPMAVTVATADVTRL